MALKRGRAAYEAELQQAQSPFVFFGKALPPLDPAVKDNGSYVPVWKQEVVDERGRKRLHGAFTGGFSAGYFNTVGSKEGWTPSTFVSSRSNRAKQDAATAQRAEDFMDEEDLAEAEESKVIGHSGVYAGLGQTSTDANRARSLIDVLRPESDNAGFKLLRKMGWKEGQGLGARIRRTVIDEDATQIDSGNDEKHFFAPRDPGLISFVKKTDRKGLGVETTQGLPANTKTEPDSDQDDSQAPSWAKLKVKPAKKPVKKGVGIGIGIFNDVSDDEDPYGMGPKIAYNRTISSNKTKTKKPVQVSANPSLVNKPVFMSKKANQQSSGNNQKCHDGRPPLEGFVLGPAFSVARVPTEHLPPSVPEAWISSKISAGILAPESKQAYMSTADAAKASTHGIASRAKLLDEAPLPGKSIFDFLTPAARDKIATATGKDNLPPGQGEVIADKVSIDTSKLPYLDVLTAKSALEREATGFVPYRDDPDKFARYHHFLSWRAGIREDSPTPPKTMSTEDFLKECSEFAHAATVFKPVSGLMASRFVSAGKSDPAKGEGVDVGAKSRENLSPQMQAAFAEQWGPLTTTKQLWHPTPLLCKRFGVEPPKHTLPGYQPDESGADSSILAARTKDLELLGEARMQELRALAGVPPDNGPAGAAPEEKANVVPQPELQKPGMEVFKAIFGSDDEDD